MRDHTTLVLTKTFYPFPSDMKDFLRKWIKVAQHCTIEDHVATVWV